MYKKILVPTDDSEHAQKAAEHAKWIAESCRAKILVLNVFETSPLKPIRSRDLRKEMQELWTKDAEEKVKNVEKILNNDNGSSIRVDYQIKEGNPADTILQTIKDEKIDLTVIGSSGKNALDRLFIGSVAENVVRSAKSPVMVVH